MPVENVVFVCIETLFYQLKRLLQLIPDKQMKEHITVIHRVTLLDLKESRILQDSQI